MSDHFAVELVCSTALNLDTNLLDVVSIIFNAKPSLVRGLESLLQSVISESSFPTLKPIFLELRELLEEALTETLFTLTYSSHEYSTGRF
jgi:hypothetical protein